MARQITPFYVDGRQGTFLTVSGEVVGTDQRSDTHVWGGGSTMVYNGTGGGSTTIQSRVDVVRDLWIKEETGEEHHFRIAQDFPVRTGQLVFVTSLQVDGVGGGKPTPFAIYNRNVDKFWWLWSGKLVPIGPHVNPIWFGLACLAVFLNGLGIPFLLYFGYRLFKGVPWLGKAEKRAKQIEEAMMEEYRRMAGETARLVPIPDAPQEQVPV